MTNITVSGSIEDAQNLLHDQLCKLDPSGVDGFEGFMAQVLSEFTGQAFHVVKSGHQQGSDVRSSPHNLFQVGLEGKRYGNTTKLPLGGLLHKITEASTLRVPVDLWLLATTRSVDASDREKLHEYGESIGIGVVVLDYPNNLSQLCDLMVICASATNACNAFLEPSAKFAEALELIRRNAEFERKRSQLLSRLTQADIGYESTRLVCECWLLEAQSSIANAKSRLGGHHNLQNCEYGVIPRRSLNTQLDEWYKSGHGIAALLGDEGTGKSWVSLDWHNTLKLSKEDTPLTVFIKAKKIDASGVKHTLAKALSTQTGIRSGMFWEKRLALWERSGRVKILILIDGLNENFIFKEWTDWLQPLFEDNLVGMYRVIVSCWPNWWNESLVGLADLTPKPQVIHVDGFNDSELDALLTTINVVRSEFTNDVLELMRVPRLSSLVAKHRKKLQKSGDITAERVIYEDWKDRLERRGQRTGLTDPEMKEFVAKLGEGLKNDINQVITTKDVIQSLSAVSGKSSLELRPAITELTSGTWLKYDNKPHTFRVAAERIPFVLGATLISQIGEATEATVIKAMIAKFLDPLNTHSLGAAILRAAMTISLIETDSSPVLRETILSKWIDEHNFNEDDFEAFWRLAGLYPALFLNLAETRWLACSGGLLSDEVMIISLANAAEFSDFQKSLKERMVKWLATVWPDPCVGMFLGKIDQTNPDSIQRTANTLARHKEWDASVTAKSYAPIIIDENEGWSWLGYRALAILSYLKRAPFIHILEAWALSRAIMHCARHEDAVAWLLRMNREDASETREAMVAVITRLKEQGNPICDQAVIYLERVMSHTERGKTALAIGEESEDEAIHMDVNGMDSEALYEAAKHYLRSFAWKKYEPEISAGLINALIERGLDENEAAFDLILDNLLDLIIVLTPDSRNSLRDVIADKQNEIKEDSKNEKQPISKLKSAQLILQLYEAEPAQQASLILSHGIGSRIDFWLPFCCPITGRDIAQINLEDAPAAHIKGWLDYVYERLSKQEIARLEFLPNLIIHDDQGVRKAALILATYGRNLPALKAFVDSPFSKAQNGEDKSNMKYEYWRHLAILESCEFSPDASLTKHMSPEHIALAANHRPTDQEVLRKFNKYLQDEFKAVNTINYWIGSRYPYSHKDAICALAEYDLGIVLKWLEPWVENMNFSAANALMNPFPIIDTMYALSSKAPQISLKLYKYLINKSLESPVSTDGIINFPLQVPESQDADEFCDKLLAEAKTDKSLLDIACSAFRNNRQDWLFAQINRLESSQIPADVAKAYTLLGSCDECSRADALWKNFLQGPPKDQWLDSVLRNSANDYARNRAARVALTDFWSNDTMWAARHALKRIEEKCDQRFYIWFWDISPDMEDSPYQHRVAINLALEDIERKIKKDNESRKKKLFHTRIGYSTMAPWT